MFGVELRLKEELRGSAKVTLQRDLPSPKLTGITSREKT